MCARCRLLVVIGLSVLLGACTTLHEVPDWQSRLHAGDRVLVTTLPDHTTTRMKITAVTPAALEGRSRSDGELTTVPAQQIAEVQRRQVSPLKTTILVVGVLGVTYALLYAAALGSIAGSL